MSRDTSILILLTTVITLGLLAAGRTPTDSKPDITGTWELNVPKSNFGKMPAPVRMSLKAARQGAALHAVQTTYDASGGPDAVEGDWYLDGRERPLGSDGKMVSMSKWEGNTLVSERKSKDGSYDEMIRLTLSSDGKTATERIQLKSPNGNNSSTMVWERK